MEHYPVLYQSLILLHYLPLHYPIISLLFHYGTLFCSNLNFYALANISYLDSWHISMVFHDGTFSLLYTISIHFTIFPSSISYCTLVSSVLVQTLLCLYPFPYILFLLSRYFSYTNSLSFTSVFTLPIINFCAIMSNKRVVVTPRDEGGKLTLADNLHSKYNHVLRCTNCNNTNSPRGLFHRNTAGKMNKEGRRCRRYVCRCGKSFSVTHFLNLCHQDPNVPFDLTNSPKSQSGIFLILFLFLHFLLLNYIFLLSITYKTNI